MCITVISCSYRLCGFLLRGFLSPTRRKHCLSPGSAAAVPLERRSIVRIGILRWRCCLRAPLLHRTPFPKGSCWRSRTPGNGTSSHPATVRDRGDSTHRAAPSKFSDFHLSRCSARPNPAILPPENCVRIVLFTVYHRLKHFHEKIAAHSFDINHKTFLGSW